MPVPAWLFHPVVILYLHGFASSAQSSKAAFFASKLEALGFELQIPDFNEPDFSGLTITRMIGQVLARIDARPREPIVLIGSSLGGFVAVQTLLQRPERVGRMVLLAPALDFNGNRLRDLGDRGLEEWERTDLPERLPLRLRPHDAAALCAVCGCRPVRPARTERSQSRFRSFRADATRRSIRGSSSAGRGARPNVELHLLDDDHQLTASLPYIWDKTEPFLSPYQQIPV